MAKLRGQLSELLGVPLLACLMPWAWFYRLARQLSRLPMLYRQETDRAVAAAAATKLFPTDEIWRRHYRLNKLIDGADPWLSRARGDRWLDRYVDVEGSWPSAPFAAVGLHWGTGIWALHHMRRQVGDVSMVLRPFAEWGGAFSAPMRLYLQRYEREIARAGGAPITPTGAGLTRRIRTNFDQGRNLLVLLDVPKGVNRDPIAIDFLGQPTYFASGAINIVLEQGRPLVPYAIGVDFATGRRRLKIHQAIAEVDTKQAMQQLAGFFDPIVRQQPPAWHFWPLHPQFLNPDFSASAS